jgi:hypothetical protein
MGTKGEKKMSAKSPTHYVRMRDTGEVIAMLCLAETLKGRSAICQVDLLPIDPIVDEDDAAQELSFATTYPTGKPQPSMGG